MKKSVFYSGIAYLTAGFLFLLAATLDTPLKSLLYGFTGAGFCAGLTLLVKYFYWTRPSRTTAYQQRLEEETIDLHDERKEMLRNKAGRYAYYIGLLVVAISELSFYVLDQLGYVENGMTFSMFLCGYLIFQFVLGVWLFHWLEKKY